MPNTRFRYGLVTTFALVIAGCGPTTPQQRLAGRWKGAPQVKDAVDSMVQSAAQGQEVNPLAQGAARFLGNALAKATMSVELDLRPSGACFLRGNTELLGLPADSDGSWTVVSANDDVAHVEFEIDDKTFPAKIVFRDADEFTLKMESRDSPATGTPEEQPTAVQLAPIKSAERLAATNREDDDEDDDPPATPAPARAAPIAIQAVPAKPGPEPAPKKQPTSIIFKRDSG